MNEKRFHFLLIIFSISLCQTVSQSLVKLNFVKVEVKVGNTSRLSVTADLLKVPTGQNLLNVNITVKEDLHQKILGVFTISQYDFYSKTFQTMIKNFTVDACRIFNRYDLRGLISTVVTAFLEHTDMALKCPILKVGLRYFSNLHYEQHMICRVIIMLRM